MAHPVFEQLVVADDDAPVGAPVRTLILLAHPDDETLGSSTLLGELGAAGRGAPVRVVHVTDGAPRGMWDARRAGCTTREEYAELRRAELAAALAQVGLGPTYADTLGVVDQEAWLGLAALAREVVSLVRALRPALLVTHPYEGGHPDHDATAFAAHAACALLGRDGAPAPALVEQTSYYADPRGAPAFVPSSFAPGSQGASPAADRIATVTLDDAQRTRKAAMYAAYGSQAGTLARFPVEVERFRPAPRYDFTRPPPVAHIWYERIGWRMSAADLCGAAAAAVAELGLPELAGAGSRA